VVDVKKHRKTNTLGPLALPMPTPNARAESLPCGSLRIMDDMPREGMAKFWRLAADMVEEGAIEKPARIVLSARGAEHVTEVPDYMGPKSTAALLLLATEICDPSEVESVGFDLACGCGLRVGVIRG